MTVFPGKVVEGTRLLSTTRPLIQSFHDHPWSQILSTGRRCHIIPGLLRSCLGHKVFPRNDKNITLLLSSASSFLHQKQQPEGLPGSHHDPRHQSIQGLLPRGHSQKGDEAAAIIISNKINDTRFREETPRTWGQGQDRTVTPPPPPPPRGFLVYGIFLF